MTNTPKTIRGLASAIAFREGKKSQARIGDIREILGILSDMVFENMANPDQDVWQVAELLRTNGKSRSKRKKKK